MVVSACSVFPDFTGGSCVYLARIVNRSVHLLPFLISRVMAFTMLVVEY